MKKQKTIFFKIKINKFFYIYLESRRQNPKTVLRIYSWLTKFICIYKKCGILIFNKKFNY